MPKVEWDQIGERLYETGVDRGVLYKPNDVGVYNAGFGWNGLTNVTESPSGAEPTALYADNVKYLNLMSLEEFGGTIEAYTYPKEFAECNGEVEVETGVFAAQQSRKPFGLSYRTRIGNDLLNEDYGYKLHLAYGLLASPSEKAYPTINDSPEAITFSWEFTSTPVELEGLKPTALLTIDSTKVGTENLAALENLLYGTEGTDPSLPTPNEVAALFEGSLTSVLPPAPGFDANVITIPGTTGVQYKIGGANVAAGALPAITVNTVVTAVPKPGYYFPAVSVSAWLFEYDD